MAKIKNPERPILFDNNILSPVTAVVPFSLKGGREMRHGAPSPGVENIIRRRKTTAFLLFELSDFLARQSSGFPYFSKDQVDAQESPLCPISVFLSREKSS